MIRIIMVMVAMVLGLTILRSLLSSIGRLVSSFIRPKSNQQATPHQPGAQHEPTAQLLRRCEQCGTYTPEGTAKRGSRFKGPAFFCSDECQIKSAAKA